MKKSQDVIPVVNGLSMKRTRATSLCLTMALLLAACGQADRSAVDRLNDQAYAWHYRSLDSAEHYARRALLLSAAAPLNAHPSTLTPPRSGGVAHTLTTYADGQAEALNNLAFASIISMDYDAAWQRLDSIPLVTDNQVELLVCYVQQMRLCQRCSRNKDFHDCRERALDALGRINEERGQLDDRQRRRLLYAETELAIVNSTYYYYVGLERQSIEALHAINPDEVKRDTAQFLNYLYNIGAGGILTEGSAADVWRQEMDCLLRCFQIARRGGYPYFTANALEAIAEHLTTVPPTCGDVPLSLVNPENLPADVLPVSLSEEALDMFRRYGDVYQTAGAYRTLASCYRAQGDYERALENLELALADTLIDQAPDLVASIREQLSVAYAAIDDKPNSDVNRNLYLDLQEETRQDRQLEARAGQLDHAVTQLNWILVGMAVSILLLVTLLWLFRYLNRRQKTESPLDEQIEERREQLAVSRRHVEEGERRHLEQRAKVSLVNSLLPLIDRMVYTIDRHGDKDYVCELIDQIEADNEMLTQWIQLRQGQLSLHIESFPLQPLFDLVMHGKKTFEMKGITLAAEPTTAVVKADRILTLFMLNTLSDNARKFTPRGGSVTLSAHEAADYVEIAVQDTGIGMSSEQLAHLFERKTIVEDTPQSPASKSHPSPLTPQSSHGFGLLNCKGIVEKYRKLSQLFKVCTLQAESKQGVGSRFFFRLPKGVTRVLAVGCWLLATGLRFEVGGLRFEVCTSAMATPSIQHPSPIAPHPSSLTHLGRAAVYADSAYFSNINGTYERTLLFADSCRQCLNDHYLAQRPGGMTLLLREGDMSPTPPEIQWLHDSVDTNYNVILDVRNESAVAALALHEWQLYAYNNRIYTQLFKELSADVTLADYCRTMQQTKTDRTIALIMLLMVLLSILPLYYFYYLRPRLNARITAERLRRADLELLGDELRRAELELSNLHVANAVLDNCLSTLKHETMYYPSRIRQLIEQNDMADAAEVVCYYRELYNLLSLQAMDQVERVKLHVKPIQPDWLKHQSPKTRILGDETLIRYLFELLKKTYGVEGHELAVTSRDVKYIEIRCTGKTPSMSGSSVATPPNWRIAHLLCRQIVRDHGEATNRRACSFRLEPHDDGTTTVTIILPRANV